MGLRFLVVEGNTREGREAHRSAFGATPSASYAGVLSELAPSAICDIVYPADIGAELPDGVGLASYDAVVLTGSALNLYDATPSVRRQTELMRAIYASGTPCFGSCWGIQVAAAAAGGSVMRNPQGIEIGFARRLVATEAGRDHPRLAGRPASFDAPAIHWDAVVEPPEGCTILARNGMSAIQAAEIRHDGGVFWGVQYHPEFSLLELAVILERRLEVLVGEGFCDTLEDAASFVADLVALHTEPKRRDLAWRYGLDAEVLDPARRTREIANFIESYVKPERSRRGRA